MPRETEEPPESTATKGREPMPRPRSGGTWVQFSSSLKEEIRPWIDLDEVEIEGFETWLRSVLPLIPRGPFRTPGKLATDPVQRLSEVARALADCAGDRARANFQAATYYRENQVLARRVRALEAVIRTTGSDSEKAALLEPEPDVDQAASRYIPKGRDAS